MGRLKGTILSDSTRKKMKDLVDSDANKVTRVFSTLFEG